MSFGCSHRAVVRYRVLGPSPWPSSGEPWRGIDLSAHIRIVTESTELNPRYCVRPKVKQAQFERGTDSADVTRQVGGQVKHSRLQACSPNRIVCGNERRAKSLKSRLGLLYTTGRGSLVAVDCSGLIAINAKAPFVHFT